MHPNIHKGAEIYHVAHSAHQLHPFFQLGKLQHVGAQQRRGQFFPGIPSRAGQLRQDIGEGGYADSQFLGQGFVAQRLGLLIQMGERLSGLGSVFGITALPQQLPRRLIAFRMYRGVVQRLGAFRYPQKTGALLKGLFPQFGYLQKLFAGEESAVLFPIGDDVFGDGGGDSRNMGQQRVGSGVQIYPHGVDTVLHYPGKGAVQGCRRHIVLILPDPDGFGIDLHQLCQRVLQTPGDGYGAAQRYVVVGKFLRRQFGGGIDRGSRLADNGIGRFEPRFPKQFGDKLFGFP